MTRIVKDSSHENKSRVMLGYTNQKYKITISDNAQLEFVLVELSSLC
jgi:hypothetical protein